VFFSFYFPNNSTTGHISNFNNQYVSFCLEESNYTSWKRNGMKLELKLIKLNYLSSRSSKMLSNDLIKSEERRWTGKSKCVGDE